MNDQMQKELLARLDALAQKFGATGEHLWKILVRQALVEVITDLACAAVFFAVGIILYKLARFFTRKAKEDKWNDVEYVVGSIGSYMVMALCFISTIAYIAHSITPLINPEYFALQQIFGK